MDVKKAIAARRSIRQYKQTPVSDELLKELLEAARLAPSGTNHQPWRFVIVRDQAVKHSIQAAAFNQKHISEAPVLLVCCADLTAYDAVDTKKRVQELVEAGAMGAEALDTYPGLNKSKDIEALQSMTPHAMLNVAIAMENIALMAVSLGLGTCIVQLMKAKKIAEMLDLPETLIITALMTIGFPDQKPAARPRIALDKIVYRVV